LEGNIYLTALLMVSGLSVALSIASWRKREASGASWLAVLLGAIALWTLMQGLSLISVKIGDKELYHHLMFIGISMVPVAVFCFVLDYYHLLMKLMRPARGALFVIPLLTVCMAASDTWHHLFYSSYQLKPVGSYSIIQGSFGLWFWVHSIYSYLLVLGALMVLIYKSLSETGAYRRHSRNLIAAILVSSLINVLTITRVLPVSVDLTPFTFILVGAVFYASLFHGGVFEMGPVTKDLLYENIQDALLVVDLSDTVVEYNSAFARLFDTPPKPILGRPLQLIFETAGYDGPSAMASLTGAHRFRTTLNAAPRTWQVSQTPLKSRSGHPAGTLYLFRDMTEIDLSLAAADEALRAANAARESITRNLSDMSHEIRTPLMGIMGAATQLKADAADAAQAADAEEILQGSQELLSTVNRVLDYSKLEAGKLHGYDEVFPLNGYLARLDALTQPSLMRSGTVEALDLKGNQHHLSQLMGLIHTFLQEGGCQNAHLELIPGPDRLEHRITFTGLAPEALELLVQWHRLEDYLTRPWRPDPLNLVLAEGLARFMGSALTASPGGSGWQLHFSFPCTWTAEARQPAPPPLESPEPRRLLFAEDSVINQAVIRRMLKGLPYELTFASDGLQALSIAEAERFDGIFTDIHMPGLGGIALSYRLQETCNRNTPIFALSSDTDADMQRQIEESPIRALVVKPCPKERLIRLLQEHPPQWD